MNAYAGFTDTLSRGLGAPHVILRRIDSTNRLARSIVVHEGATLDPWPPCWLVAFEQDAGRGRLGRSWKSEAGLGIYATLLVDLSVWTQDRIARLPLMVGTAAVQALRAPLGASASADEMRLKWPNDLVVSGRKLGGILIESLERRGRRFGIVGIGVNHGQEEPHLPEPRASSLRIIYRAADIDLPTLGDTAVALCRAVADGLADPAAADEALESYRELIAHRVGDQLSWSSHQGPVHGRFVEIDADGAIVIETATGLERVSSGDVLQVENDR